MTNQFFYVEGKYSLFVEGNHVIFEPEIKKLSIKYKSYNWDIVEEFKIEPSKIDCARKGKRSFEEDIGEGFGHISRTRKFDEKLDLKKSRIHGIKENILAAEGLNEEEKGLVKQILEAINCDK